MFDCSQHQIHHHFLFLTTAVVVTKKKKPRPDFFEETGQVLVNMLERKRNYTKVSHQTLVLQFKARGEQTGMCVGVCAHSKEKKNMNTMFGSLNKEIHTVCF